MMCRRIAAGWLVLITYVSCVGTQAALAQAPWNEDREWWSEGRIQTISGPSATSQHSPSSAVHVPLDSIPADIRESVRLVLEQPKLHAHGASEVFPCRPQHYHWLLDHPDQAARIWMSLGAKNLNITERGDGHFGWTDSLGSDVRWQTIHSTPQARIWYAEGSIRPALLLPSLPARAVVMLRFVDGCDEEGRTVVRHQADVYLYSDNKTVAIAARLVGASMSNLAEQFAGQVELFFSAMAWYLDRHPAAAQALLGTKPVSKALEPATFHGSPMP